MSQLLGTLFPQYAWGEKGAMVQRVLKQGEDRAAGPRLGILSAKDHPADPGVHDGPAHMGQGSRVT